MYEVIIRTDFAAAHNLRDVGGKCESLHGHNFIVEVAVEAQALDPGGMVVDFRLLKAKTRSILEHLDHHYLNELPFFQDKNPSSENIAAHIFHELSHQLAQATCRVSWVAVWESESSRAVYRKAEK